MTLEFNELKVLAIAYALVILGLCGWVGYKTTQDYTLTPICQSFGYDTAEDGQCKKTYYIDPTTLTSAATKMLMQHPAVPQ